MLYEVDWAEDGTYRPGEFNSPEKFFNDCLENSKEFDLQLGYFSSATISVLADGFASFISNGGRMRLVINHIVSEEDKEAISKGLHGGIIDCFDLTNFETLRQTFDEYQQQFFECLAFLIYDKRIDIRIINLAIRKVLLILNLASLGMVTASPRLLALPTLLLVDYSTISKK